MKLTSESELSAWGLVSLVAEGSHLESDNG